MNISGCLFVDNLCSEEESGFVKTFEEISLLFLENRVEITDNLVSIGSSRNHHQDLEVCNI